MKLEINGFNKIKPTMFTYSAQTMCLSSSVEPINV